MKSVHALLALVASISLITTQARASIAYGSINNFDTVNDTGHECHGFEIELDDCHSKDVTYTYNYNHYGVPEITEDLTDPAHPKTFIKWQSKKNADGTWAAFTAIPAGPIAPTQGHQFTNPAVNFGGEHFGVGYTVPPSAVLYNWLIDNGSGTLVHGGAVQVSTPVYTYYPPAAAQPAQIVAVIAPPPPPAPPVKEFGKAVWVKEIKTTTHNAEKVKLRELVSDDPDHPEKKNWKNGEPDEVEVEWRILQKKTSAADGGVNNNVPAAAEPLPNGNEVVTRRYEFYKYTGPLDAETNEAMGDAVGSDGTHGTGSRTYADHFDGALGEWVTVTKDMSTFVIVGDFTGSQMAAVDVDAAVGLIDHVGEGKVNKAFAPRTVVVEGSLPFTCTHEGAVPPGMTMNDATGVLSGTPTAAGQYQFSVTASDGINPDVQKNYTMSVAAIGAALPAQNLLDTAAAPVGSGTTTGDGSYAPGSNATVTATPAVGFHFVNWTDNAQIVSTATSYTLAMDVNHSLVVNFAPDVVQWNITTSAAPVEGGTTTGDGLYDDGSNVTLVATANAGYSFTNWTEGGLPVSSAASYTFVAGADHDLVANFTALPTYTVSTGSAPVAGGTVGGGGSFVSGSSVTVTATPNAGYFFVNWTDASGQVSANASYTFPVTANKALTANFSIIGTTLRNVTTSSNPVAGGSTTGGGAYADGSSVTVVATPNVGYKFNKWKQGGSSINGAGASYTFTVTADRALVATFTPVYYITGVSNPTNGGTTVTDSSSYPVGDNGNIQAAAASGYQFANWTESGNIVSTSTTFNFTNVQANHTYVANFQLIGGVTINASAAPLAGGTVSGDGGYMLNDSVTVSAVANPGYAFTNWTQSGTVVSSSADYTFTASVNRTLVANFMQVVTHSIVTSSAPALGGSTSGGGSYNTGTSVTVSAVANAGYAFQNWTEGVNVVATTPDYTFNASANRTLVAHFGVPPPQWTITANVLPATGGSVTGDGLVDDGSQVTLSATASPGYTFSKWTEGANDVSTSPNYAFTASADRTLTANFTLTSTGVKFDFDATTTPVAIGQVTPFDQLSASIGGNFSSPDAEGFTVGDAVSTGYALSSLTGKYLVAGAGSRELDVQFNNAIAAVSVNFASTLSVKLTAIDHSSGSPVTVGTTTASGTSHQGESMPTGTLQFANGSSFDQLIIEVTNPPANGPAFLVDCITVTPITVGGYLSLINPNWNITLTDAGYSDLLLDNTPGFEGREYLSGEWGAAVGYKVGATTRSPKWLERNFIYPDWITNSNFNVVSPIALIGSNADGLPIAQSVIANNDLEITIRYEMLDTVTGMPMGVAAASNGGAGNDIKSNRYVLNQSYTVKNISGSTITNLQVFQMLHGLTSQHGVYDNRVYTGKHSDYRFDVTLGGVDASSIGAAGASTTGFEDFIGFGAKLAPTAYEIGHYGIDPVDNHSTGKPSDGVHLSIENNWTSAPYTTRQATDYFAPANRWIAGAQRYDLATLNDGQSATVDVMLSILTGTTVTITGGNGGNHGTGSCNGGSSHIGGVDFDIEGVTQEGTFFGQESEADDTEIEDRIGDGEFVLPNFAQPGGLSQVWNLKYNGAYTGKIKLKFNYDPALLPAGFDAKKLTIWHFTNGAWEQLVGVVDTTNHTITVTTSSLSPFMLGLPTTNAVPQINVTQLAGGNRQLNWTSDTTGWVLEESADLINWAPSSRVVSTVGNNSTVNVIGAGSCCFFRLAHP